MAAMESSRGKMFRLFAGAALSKVPAGDGAAFRYVWNDVTGPMVLRSPESLLGGGRKLEVTPTGRMVKVGLVDALELEIVYADAIDSWSLPEGWAPCFYAPSVASTPVPVHRGSDERDAR
jgi:hypothetical protein